MSEYTRSAGLLAVLLLAAPAAAADKPLTIVCLGDSVTRGVRSGVKPGETFCALLEKKLATAGIAARVVNAGVGGHTTADGLKRLASDVLARKPGYAVVMFGLNDSWIDKGQSDSRITVAEYAGNLRKMIGALRKSGIVPILMTPNPVIAPKYPPARNVRLKKYIRALRALAVREKVALVDVYAMFGEMRLEGVDLNKLFTDAMHPNPRGHEEIADLLAQDFQRVLRKRIHR